ncbi:DNA polymerase III subunit epsilon (plasmid) [Citricoccus nitrophenolicus]
MNLSVWEGLNFTAIDFETANEKRGSVIQVGVTRVEDGQVVDTAVKPIKLHSSLYRFAVRNVAVHGLDASYVRRADPWPQILDWILEFAGDPTHLVAHNASVERSCIDQACAVWGLPASPMKYLDTMALAKAEVPGIDPGYAGGYGLEPLALHFGVPDFGHHDAGEDALATARLALRIAELTQAPTTRELWRNAGSMKPKASPRTQTVRKQYVP